MKAEPPLDFSKTLAVLDDWTGRTVQVIAHSQAPGAPMSHTQTVFSGELGRAQMVDNQIDPDVESVAAYPVGGAPNGFYLSLSDFVHCMQVAPTHVNIKFRHDFHIEIHIVE